MEWIPGTLDDKFKPYVTIGGIKPRKSGKRSTRGVLATTERIWVIHYYDGTRSVGGHVKWTVEEQGPFLSDYTAALGASTFAASKGWLLSPYVRSILHSGPVNFAGEETAQGQLTSIVRGTDKPYIGITRLGKFREQNRISELLNVKNAKMWVVIMEVQQDEKPQNQPQYKIIHSLGVFKTAKMAKQAAFDYAQDAELDMFC